MRDVVDLGYRLKISSDGKVVMSDYAIEEMSMPMPVNRLRAACVYWPSNICVGENIGKWSEEHGWHNVCESHEAERLARFWESRPWFKNGLGA
jgi:hypothetical protein